MRLFLTSSPIGTYRSEEPLTYSGFNPANGMVDALKQYWKDDARCLLISAFPDEYEFNDRMRAYILCNHRRQISSSDGGLR